jgi:uncharacterized membrane protein
MGRFIGRPWMAAAFTTFIIAALSLFVRAPLWFIAVPLGLAFITVDMTRPGPPPADV